MAVTRADSFTSAKKQQEYFSDFLDNFDKTPIGDNLARVTNDKAVTQSLRNLIFTNFGDRLFQPSIGSNILGSLFELSGVVFENMLRDSILSTIASFEPRAQVQQLVITDPNFVGDPGQPASVDKNAIQVTIVYTLVNSTTPITLTVLLRRIR